MKNRIESALAFYKKNYYNRPDCAGAFYASDAYDVIAATKIEGGGGDYRPVNPYDVVFTALNAGFAIGYKKAQRDASAKAKR